MNILIQCIISYIGLLPYIYCLIDIYFLEYLSPIILLNIMVYNTLLIFTFIGAINWDFGKGTIFLTIYGFIPSLISFGIIISQLLISENIRIIFYLAMILLFVSLNNIYFSINNDNYLHIKVFIDKIFHSIISYMSKM